MHQTYIQTAEARQTPFHYFTSSQVLSSDLANNLLYWLEAGVQWKLHNGGFFEQYECNLLNAPTPNGCAALFERQALEELKRRIQTLLGTELSDRIQVVAHKLLPSQGIGIHNDEPHDDLETHRFILQLNHGWRDEYGGHLLLFNSKNPFDIHAVVGPGHNTGMGFAMSARSYHAVSDVRHGVRYTVIFSFWQTQAAKELHDGAAGSTSLPGGAADGESAERRKIQPLLRFLESAAAHETDHSGGDLLKHLTNTYGILRRWGCAEPLCVAGLFHSVYGTQAFRHAAFTLQQRQQVWDVIGTQAEQTAYLYCVANRSSIYENLDREAGYCLQTFKDGATISISRECLADLMTLDLANALEQLARIPLTLDMIETERAIYEKAASLLPGAAIAEMQWAYQRRNVALEQLPLEAQLAKLDADAQTRIESVLRAALAKEQA